MTAHHRRRTASGALAALLTGLALAGPPALAAEPATTPLDSDRGFGLARDLQAIGADAQPLTAQGHDAPAAGFDWTAAAIGAAGAAGVVIVVVLAAPPLGVRRRVRPTT
jgi:hypothetical protein